MMEFRVSRRGDIPAILSIIGQARAYLAAQGIDQWQDGYPDEEVVSQDIGDLQGYVLTLDGTVFGIATITFDGEPSYDVIEDGVWTTKAPFACVHRVALDASARGTGASDVLMAEVEAVIRARGFADIRIDTHPENQVMRRMLERNGYRRCGVIHLCGGKEDGAPRIALEKQLKQFI